MPVAPFTIDTASGATIHVTRVGVWFDLHVKNPKGETIATVSMSEDDLSALVDGADYALGY